MSSSTAYNTLDKTPNEDVTFGMPFSPKMAAGDSLVNAGTVTQPIVLNGVDTGIATTDLTFAGPVITPNMPYANPPGPGVSVRISGGLSGTVYMLHFKGVITNFGDTLESEGMLNLTY